MKKLFTLIAAALMAVTVNAKTILTSSWNSWGDGCTVSGNTLTFKAAYKGAGYWVSPTDCTGNDVLVVVFDGPVKGSIKLYAQFVKATKNSSETMINDGDQIAKVDLTDANSAPYINDLSQVCLQVTSNSGSCTVSQVYVGSNAEYEADKANHGTIVSDMPLALTQDWGNGKVAPTDEDGNQVVTFATAWNGAQHYFDSFDATKYEKVVCDFAEAVPCQVQLTVQYVDADADNQTDVKTLVDAGAKTVEQVLDKARKAKVKSIFLQTAEPATLKVAKFYLAAPTTAGINKVVAPAASTSAPIYNLAGQRVSKTYKGVVIQNGRKYLQK